VQLRAEEGREWVLPFPFLFFSLFTNQKRDVTNTKIWIFYMFHHGCTYTPGHYFTRRGCREAAVSVIIDY